MTASSATDGTLVTQVGLPTGADAAITTLFRVHRLGLLRLAVLLIDDEQLAEDIVQDAFFRLHQRWRRVNDHDKALSYLRASVINGSRSALRRRRTARKHQPSPPAALPSAEASVLLNELHSELLAGLATLPRRQREVLVCRYYLDMSEAQIAHALAIGTGSVKSHASRGIAALTVRLENRA